MAELVQFKADPLTLVGVQGTNAVVLHQFYLPDPKDREATIEALLESLADNAIVILGPVLIRTERFDSFKVV